MAQIICENLSLGYDSTPVLQNINFTVNKGDFLCIIGENGSGKTTLLKTLAGVVAKKDGRLIFGDDIKPHDIGYMPQQSGVQKDFPASVEEIVLSGYNRQRFNPFYTKPIKEQALSNLEKMGISHLRLSCYRTLSGGQQQRVLLARALMSTGKLLLLDEPTLALDTKTTKEMYTVISDLNKSGVTVVMVSHDIETALKYATHVLKVGKNMFYGTIDEFLSYTDGGDIR